MRRIIIKEARPEMTVGRAVVEEGGGMRVVLAQAGEVLTVERLLQLHEKGVYDLWVDDPGLEFFDSLCAQRTGAQLELVEGLRDSFLRLAPFMPRDLITRHGVLVEEVLGALVRTAPTVPCFGALVEDEKLLAHSCDVAAVSTMLGLQLENYLIEQRRRLNGRQAGDVANLALGALLHDVGELMLPHGQRESQEAEMDGEEWKQHVREGYRMVHGRVDASAAGVILHHHQKFDGTGFGGLAVEGKWMAGSEGLSGGAIHIFARIVMAADVLCRVLFAGSRLPQPMVRALWEVQQVPLRMAFDPVVHGCLMGTFQPFVAGMVVMLSDNRQAVVTAVDGRYPCYPEVRAMTDAEEGGDRDVRLAERGDLRVSMVDGVDVERYLYGARKAAPLAA
jgi:HD-GYP domain-containing protein (c-di-GMP phosphodiesterase class II)